MWVHEHPVHALVHPCIIVVFIVIIDTWLLTHSQYMYTTTQLQAATSMLVQSCTVCCSYVYTDCNNIIGLKCKIVCTHTLWLY